MFKRSRPSNTVVTVHREWITPKIAQELLTFNDPNRTTNVDPVIIECYVDQMNRGEWFETGDCLKFNRSGRLIDGTHRLLAIIEAGWSGWTHIAYGVVNDAAQAMTPPGQS